MTCQRVSLLLPGTVLLLLAAGLGSGCAQLEGHEGAATGAVLGGAIGAASGAAIGGSEHRAGGAILGGVAGAAAGGAAGHYGYDERKK